MNYRAIIGEAWAVTRQNKPLIMWFAFLPAFIHTLSFIIYFTYQTLTLQISPFALPGSEHFWESLINFSIDLFQNNASLAVVLVVISAIMGLIYLFIPVFSEGALIQLLAGLKAGRPPSIMEGIGLGLRRFLQLFEYHLAIKTFSVVSIFTNAVFVFRSFGPESFGLFAWLFVGIFIIGLFFSLLFTYTEYFIVIDDKGMLNAMVSSIQLVMRQWHHTLFMLLLMVIISARIVFNVLVSLLVPFLVIAPILLFTSLTLTIVGVVIGGILGLVSLYFASYFMGVIHLFSVGVWTYTFLELTTHQSGTLREELESHGSVHHD